MDPNETLSCTAKVLGAAEVLLVRLHPLSKGIPK